MTINFSAGQLVTSNQMNLLAPLFVSKASNQSVTNSATLVNDNDIVFTLVANQTVNVSAFLNYQGNSTTNVGLRAAWTTTGTLSLLARVCVGPNDGSGAQTPDSMLMQSRPLVAFNTNNLYTSGIVASVAFSAREELLFTTGASGGTLQFQFAEFTATAATSIQMNSGSFAVARYVA